jgi:hypothetical protein
LIGYTYLLARRFFVLIDTYLLACHFFIAFFILACSPLGGQARGKPRYPA